jgi:hypothetical protein
LSQIVDDARDAAREGGASITTPLRWLMSSMFMR